ncbi:MAG: Asp/Glu/hydantoin racemase [Mesorhizobium sp.]|nr:MAG: Asp/Glu/hydantoin racemase [Mesorhizobium sp.]RWD80718.1 MAG: Asp/Glu/hydantoin racemase [Mesorhizobium sp.]TJW65993.1 MAG: Asp/Glu/hydantoin racemase [Mesorhizobium sp.]
MLVPRIEPQNRQWSSAAYEVDAGIGSRAHIGMVVFDCDQTLSHEARAMLAIAGVALYESRISSHDDSNQPLTSGALADDFVGLDEAVRQINATRPSNVVALGCTSAAMVIGPDELERRVRSVHPQAHVTDPFTAILAALRVLNSVRVGFVSPYPAEIAEDMVNRIETAGIWVPTVSTFHNQGGFVRGDAPFISPASIAAAVHRIVEREDIDTVVIACTQMRAAATIDELERQTGKAVISSNQALCWHALRLAKVSDVVLGWGRLFEADL